MSNPIRSSERYELTATSATSLNQARTRALAIRKHPRRQAVRGTQQTGVLGQPLVWQLCDLGETNIGDTDD
jgi:hypothetical protein